MNAVVSGIGAAANLLLNGDTVRYLELGISAIQNGVAAREDMKELQTTWAANAQAIIDRGKADPTNPDAGKPTADEWADVRGMEDANYAASQAPLTHEGG